MKQLINLHCCGPAITVFKYQILMEIRPVGADSRKDRQDEGYSRFSQFCERAKKKSLTARGTQTPEYETSDYEHAHFRTQPVLCFCTAV